VQMTNNPIAHDTEEFGVAWHVGDDATGTGGSRTFPGSIDSVSVYLSALSTDDLLTLYDVGVGAQPPVQLDIAPSTPGSLTLSWSSGALLQATNLSGPWTTNSASSPYKISPTNAHMFFKVIVH
ncbi:MAG TPA: hypothetical protein VGN61_12885, partial [Verrucomicrobiae bacterium]